MVFALFGSTCSGKTSVARELHRRHTIPVRHCGEVVKAIAAAQGIKVSGINYEHHAKIDSETRRMAETAEGELLIEGTFLDVVLHGVSEVRMIKLTCSDLERMSRYLRRGGTEDEFMRRDALDNNLRLELYSGRSARADFMEVDTKELSLDQVSDATWRRFKEPL